jgi:hypothetical protein
MERSIALTLLQTDTLRRNDHATIGGIISCVLTPAIFWKQASVVNGSILLLLHQVLC